MLPTAWNERIKRAPIMGQIVELVARVTVKSASHQEIYDQRYNAFLDAAARKSVGPMAATIKRLFKPNSVMDVGCGTGALLAQLKLNGLEIRGLEYSDAGIARCREKGVQVEKFDLEGGDVIEGKCDLTVSFEVAEHLPESLADNYVQVISQFSPVVMMSAATVGQGGKDHVNEQPHEYWIEKMQRQGFAVHPVDEFLQQLLKVITARRRTGVSLAALLQRLRSGTRDNVVRKGGAHGGGLASI